MQSNNFLRPFSTNTTNIYSDSDIATLSVIGTGAVNNAIADSKLYNSLSATTTLACTALIDFVAAQNPSVNFGQTLPIDNWISAVTNAFATKQSVDNILNGTTPVPNAINSVVNTDTSSTPSTITYLSLQRNASSEKIGISTTNYNLMQYETLYENLNGYVISTAEAVLLPNTAGKMYNGRDLLIIAYVSSDTIQNSCSCIMSSRPLTKRSNMFSYWIGTGAGSGNVRHFYIELSGGAVNSEGIYININSVEGDTISPPEITLYKILALN